MKRREKLRKLKEDGYQAALAGKPCNAPTTRELERAAWEIGWRSGRQEKESI
jgi:ribosome modulation factor